jgi:hypothetical protein
VRQSLGQDPLSGTKNVNNAAETKNVNNAKNTTVTSRPATAAPVAHTATPVAHAAMPAGEHEGIHTETHAISPAATGTTRPGTTANTKASLVKPKPGTTSTNQAAAQIKRDQNKYIVCGSVPERG